MPVTQFQVGKGDDYFIARTRRMLRDQPVVLGENKPSDGTQGTTAPGSKPFRLDKPPIIRGSVRMTAVGGATVIYDATPAAGQASVNTDTGELTFFTAPGAGNIALTYQTAKWSDQEIVDALNEGAFNLYPEIWQPITDPPVGSTTSATAIVLAAPTTFEYTLPQFLWDARRVILSVEVLPPSGFTRWFEIRDWDRVGLQGIKFGQPWTPGTVVRLTYNAQYEALGDLEPEVQHLPIYYAVGRLLADQETERARQSELVPLTGQGAAQPGTAAKIADLWFQKFAEQKKVFERPTPVRRWVPLPTQ